MELDPRIWDVYELLENDQYEQALKKLEGLMRNTVPRPPLLSLKAYILMKCGRSADALQVALQVKKTGVQDLGSLQNLSAVFRSAGKINEAIELYCQAVAKSPANEELGRAYLNLLIKDHRFKDLQTHAIKMHRQFKSPQYLFWIVMCLAIQAEKIRSEDSEKFEKDISYTLAERYLQKAATDKLIKGYEELYLYFMVYMGQGKKELALGLLDGPLGKSARVAPKIRYLRLDLLATLGHHDRIIELASQILEEDIDNWNAYLAYIGSVDSLYLSNGQECSQCDEKTHLGSSEGLSRAQSFINTLKHRSSQLPAPKRGPFLAELELSSRSHGDTISVIIQYLERFGSKACAFEDLVPYLSDIAFVQSRSEDLATLRKHLDNELSSIDITRLEKKDAIKTVQLLANYYKIHRFISSKSESNVEEIYQLVDVLMKIYSEALPLGSELETTEKQYGDDLALIAAHYLIDAYEGNPNNLAHLVHAAVLLEHTISRSPHNFHMKFLLVRIYHILGVYQRPVDLFMSLDIKHVQLDTLSHLVVDSGVSLGHFNSTFSSCHSARAIYSRNRAETPEMLVKAFHHNTFSKIPEFIKFQSRLENSLQRRITDFELLRSELFSTQGTESKCSLLDSVPKAALIVDSDTLSDNRDFEVLLSFTHSSVKDIDTLTSLMPRRSPLWIQSMMLMYHILQVLVSSSSSSELTDLLNQSDGLFEQKKFDEGFSTPEKQFLKVSPAIAKIVLKNDAEALDTLQTIPRELLSYQGTLPESNVGLYLHSIFVTLEIFSFLTIFKTLLTSSRPEYTSINSDSIPEIETKLSEILDRLKSQFDDNLEKLRLHAQKLDISDLIASNGLGWLDNLSSESKKTYLDRIQENLQSGWESAGQQFPQSIQ